MLCIIQAFYFPIDPRLNFFVANKLLKELAVRTTSDPCIDLKNKIVNKIDLW